MKKQIETKPTQPQTREPYQEPLLIKHEPLLDITGQKSGEKAAATEKQLGSQGGMRGGGVESTD